MKKLIERCRLGLKKLRNRFKRTVDHFNPNQVIHSHILVLYASDYMHLDIYYNFSPSQLINQAGYDLSIESIFKMIQACFPEQYDALIHKHKGLFTDKTIGWINSVYPNQNIKLTSNQLINFYNNQVIKSVFDEI